MNEGKKYSIVAKDDLTKILNAIQSYSDTLNNKENKIALDLQEIKKTIYIDNQSINNHYSDIIQNFKTYRNSFMGAMRLYKNLMDKYDEAAIASGSYFDSTYSDLSGGIK